jgi:hypothetical protein
MASILPLRPASVERMPRLQCGARIVAMFREGTDQCAMCGARRDAHRATDGQWVGCNVARVQLLDAVSGRLRHALARCAVTPLRPFGVDGEDSAHG